MNEEDNISFPVVALGQIGEGVLQSANARELHAYLENRDAFANWIADRIRQYGFVENVDFVTYLENTKKGRPSKEYRISLDMAKEMAMVERNEKGKQVRRYFIECERRALTRSPALDMRDIGQLQVAALQLIEMNQEKDEKIAVLLPKAEAMDRLETSEGSVGPRLAAKMLNMPERKFIKWLEANHWAFRQNGVGPLQAYKDKRERGYLEHRPHTYYDQVRGEDRTIAQMMITPKGLARLAVLLGVQLEAAA
ncbi:antA/AntB antirepressor family protein [Sphingobium fuliginis]|jgi:anti-repressor protein|uniref:antA/AntB antirepressor family protein n=1 Tax=Sphingobium fuliginis (strain ATCC 27551) TaxID=336203 RepID=UPI0037C93677